MGSASYITYLTFGLNPHSGEGSSLTADIYLNFGVFGVVFFMFLFGMFYKKADNGLKTIDNLNWIIIAAVLASSALSFGRSTLFSAFRPMVWSLILMTVFVKTRKVIK